MPDVAAAPSSVGQEPTDHSRSQSQSSTSSEVRKSRQEARQRRILSRGNDRLQRITRMASRREGLGTGDTEAALRETQECEAQAGLSTAVEDPVVEAAQAPDKGNSSVPQALGSSFIGGGDHIRRDTSGSTTRGLQDPHRSTPTIPQGPAPDDPLPLPALEGDFQSLILRQLLATQNQQQQPSAIATSSNIFAEGASLPSPTKSSKRESEKQKALISSYYESLKTWRLVHYIVAWLFSLSAVININRCEITRLGSYAAAEQEFGCFKPIWVYFLIVETMLHVFRVLSQRKQIRALRSYSKDHPESSFFGIPAHFISGIPAETLRVVSRYVSLYKRYRFVFQIAWHDLSILVVVLGLGVGLSSLFGG